LKRDYQGARHQRIVRQKFIDSTIRPITTNILPEPSTLNNSTQNQPEEEKINLPASSHPNLRYVKE
jgi:hypothetical protein